MGLRSLNELRALATVLDLLVEGKHALAADVIAMRFQAVETAASQGSWSTARHMELVETGPLTAVDEKEKKRALKEELVEIKYRKDLLSTQNRGNRPIID